MVRGRNTDAKVYMWRRNTVQLSVCFSTSPLHSSGALMQQGGSSETDATF